MSHSDEGFPGDVAEFDRDWLTPGYWPLWLGFGLVWILSHLPVSFRHWLAGVFAHAAFRWNPKRRGVVLANLELAFPDLDQLQREQLARQHFFAMSRSFMDMGLLWFASDKALCDAVRVEGGEHFHKAISAGKPVIFHVAHCAALEFGAVAVACELQSASGMYQPLKNPLLNWQVLRARSRFGNRVTSRLVGYRQLLKAVKSGRPLYMLTDEDFGLGKGVQVSFFGHAKSTIVTTAKLAAANDAVVIPMMSRFEAGESRYVAHLGQPLADFGGVRDSQEHDALRLNRALEALIEKAPYEYMWVLKIYRSTAPQGFYARGGSFHS